MFVVRKKTGKINCEHNLMNFKIYIKILCKTEKCKFTAHTHCRGKQKLNIIYMRLS